MSPASPIANIATAMPATKGVAFVNGKAFVEANYGLAAWHNVLAKLARDDRDIVESASAVGWYDLMVFARMLRAIDQVCGVGDLSLLPKIGISDVERDFNRTIRIIIRILSPDQIFKVSTRLWSHFQSAGAWSHKSVAQGKGMDSTLTGWGADRALCLELTGYVKRLLELTGAHDVAVRHDQCRGLGHGNCVFNVRWR